MQHWYVHSCKTFLQGNQHPALDPNIQVLPTSNALSSEDWHCPVKQQIRADSCSKSTFQSRRSGSAWKSTGKHTVAIPAGLPGLAARAPRNPTTGAAVCRMSAWLSCRSCRAAGHKAGSMAWPAACPCGVLKRLCIFLTLAVRRGCKAPVQL